MINNRQPGRRRGRGSNPGGGGGGGGGNGGGGGGGQRQGNPGRGDSGNRIDSRARGNASQLYEKYKNLASDAQRQGDRVNIENYLQYADHYFRVLSEQRGPVTEQQPRRQRDDYEFDGDEEFGDEGDTVRMGEQGEAPRYDDRPREAFRGDQREGQQREGQQRDGQQRDGQQREAQPRDSGQRDNGQQRENGQQRDTYQRGEGRPRAEPRLDGEQRGEAQGEQRPPRGEWQDRERRPQRNEESRPVEVAGQRRADPIVANESLESRAEDVLEADRPLDAPAPRRRGRPRREQVEVGSGPAQAAFAEPPQGESHEAETGGGEPIGLDADRLPPSLTMAANDEAPVADAKPRRRRVRAAETPTAAE